MRKIFILLMIFITTMTFDNTSYAESADNESQEDKVIHSIYDMSVIEKQLEAYKKEHGKYPKTEDGLENIKKYTVTVVPDHIVPNRYLEGNSPYATSMKWKGYKFQKPDLIDGWGRQYEYISNGIKYSIHSYGEDGIAGGAGFGADIVIYSSK